MPVRHFLCRDYLHILCYIKFLLFCSLAPDEVRILCGKNKGVVQKTTVCIQIKSLEGKHPEEMSQSFRL